MYQWSPQKFMCCRYSPQLMDPIIEKQLDYVGTNSIIDLIQ